MRWRTVCDADVLACLKVEPRHTGAEIVGREAAVTIWKSLIQSPSFNSAVVECVTPNSPARVIGFGASLFVNSGFVTDELERPRAFINSRILASIASGKSVVQAQTELCTGRTSDVLDLIILYGNLLTDSLLPEQVSEAQMLLAFSFLEQHSGYRLNRIIIETVGEAQRAFNQSSGVWRKVQDYPEHRTLFVLTAKEAYTVSGSIAAGLFHYEEPVLRLHPTDKHLLAEALNGGTDGELATRLHLTLPCIKKRWESVFERVSHARPDLLPEVVDGNARDSRGPQKRHKILAYVRSHPSELRPFRWRL